MALHSDLHRAAIAAASPSRGRSIAGVVAPLVDEMHAAVGTIRRLAKRSKYVPNWLDASGLDQVPFTDPWARIGWAVSAIGLIEALQTRRTPNISRALAWFEGKSRFENRKWGSAEASLSRVAAEPGVGALLPYLLDTYGRTSRLDVLRDESLSTQRNARKKVGSFYTPADVAYFMAASIARAAGAAEAAEAAMPTAWLDPAIGSGVFLVAALRREKDLGLDDPVKFATDKLFGADISPQACDFAAFAVLNEIAGDVATAPMVVWQAIRTNLVALDALSLLEADNAHTALAKHFPRLNGPIRLICNPPYASASDTPERIGRMPGRSLYLPFVEMTWRLADGPADASCLVVPLALGANTTADHRRARIALAAAGGRWTMLFFDRQPHALFGEEAKTRATIAIRRPGPKPADIWTSGLLKWTSRQRVEIFSENRAVDLGPARIGRLVPKLSGTEEVCLYDRLSEYRLRRPDRPRIEKAAPDEIVGTALSNDVFVGATAYNFLNIFRNYPDHLSWRGELSLSGVHKLSFTRKADASVATALLASRAAFWLWHTECDGFHVPSWFLYDLPLLDLPFETAQRNALADLGDAIWVGLQEDILVSKNRKKLTFAFRPSEIGPLRDQTDIIILQCLGASDAELAMLGAFETRVVSIDGTRRTARSSPTAVVTKKGLA